jgi:hypothetical protein
MPLGLVDGEIRVIGFVIVFLFGTVGFTTFISIKLQKN